VIVVDDNRDAADTLGQIMSGAGYDVRVEYDGNDAIRGSDEFLPQVALLDIGLPGHNGYEIAQHIRAHRKDDVLLIAVTGYGAAEDRRKASEAGFDHYFTKPADPMALLDVIEHSAPSAR
jgi:DNA-binding response OmpR family regulator